VEDWEIPVPRGGRIESVQESAEMGYSHSAITEVKFKGMEHEKKILK